MTLQQTDLHQFTGSECFYRHPLFRGFVYTEGVQYLAEKAGAYWLIDKIFACQQVPKLSAEGFQFWTLRVEEDRSARLACTDGNDRRLHRETLGYTDFPLPEIKLYFTDRTLLLPSEY